MTVRLGNYRVLATLLIVRLLLVGIVTVHLLSKVTGFEAFLSKFDFVGPVLAVLIILAELVGVTGLLLGAALPNGVGRWITRVGVTSIAIVQVGAAVAVHNEGFFFYANGFEYNLVLLGLCLVLFITPNGLLAADQYRVLNDR